MKLPIKGISDNDLYRKFPIIRASIAQSYLCALAGENPSPSCRLRAEGFRGREPQKTTKGKNVAGKYELCLRLSPEEKQRLEEDAKRCRLSKSVYLRSLITGTPVRVRPSQEIKGLRKEVHQIGNNINQIALYFSVKSIAAIRFSASSAAVLVS